MKIGLLQLLGVVFITLKLVGYIDWSWWWVLLPMYLPLLILIVLFTLVGMFSYMES